MKCTYIYTNNEDILYMNKSYPNLLDHCEALTSFLATPQRPQRHLSFNSALAGHKASASSKASSGRIFGEDEADGAGWVEPWNIKTLWLKSCFDGNLLKTNDWFYEKLPLLILCIINVNSMSCFTILSSNMRISICLMIWTIVDPKRLCGPTLLHLQRPKHQRIASIEP